MLAIIDCRCTKGAYFGLTAVQPLGTVLASSYNTYLGQRSELWSINLSETAIPATLRLVRSDGTEVLANNPASANLQIPGHGLWVTEVSDLEIPEQYGFVEVQPAQRNQIASWVLRRRAPDYTIVTPCSGR